MLLALVNIGLAAGAPEVHHPGQLAGGRGVGPGLVHPAAQPPIEHAQRGVTAAQHLRGELEGLAGAVGRTLAPRGQHLAGGKAADVGADLRKQLHHHRHAQPVDTRVNGGQEPRVFGGEVPFLI